MRRTTRLMVAAVIWAVFPLHAVLAQHGAVLDQLPGKPDVKARYVIYLHGRIIEDRGRRPTHDTWGVYEYQLILEKLAADGLVVISKQRPPMTDMDTFQL